MAFPDSGQQGDPARGLLSWMKEPVRGVPLPSTRHDMDYAGEVMANTLASLARTAITRAGEAAEPLEGKRAAAASITLDALNPSQDWVWPCYLLGHSETPVAVETGAYRHRISHGATDVNYDETLCLLAWRDDGFGQRFPESIITQLAISFGADALVGATVTAVPRVGDYWADGAIVAGTSLAPSFRGIVRDSSGDGMNFPTGAWATDAASNIWVKIVSQTSTTVTVLIKVGTATAYGVTSQTFTKATWSWVRDQAGARIGDRGTPGEIFFPTATYVANDEWSFARRRGEWTPSFADRSTIIREIYSSILIDGVEEEVKSGTVTLAKPGAAISAFGGQQARRTRSRGQATAVLAFGKEYQNPDYRRRLELAKSLSYRLDLRSKIGLGTTGDLQHSISIISPLCKLTGAPSTVPNANTADESLSMTAHPSSDGTYPSAVTVEIITSIPSLIAA